MTTLLLNKILEFGHKLGWVLTFWSLSFEKKSQKKKAPGTRSKPGWDWYVTYHRQLQEIFEVPHEWKARQIQTRRAVKAESERLGFGLLTSSEVSMRNGTLAAVTGEAEVPKMRTLKQVKAENSAEDESVLKELSTDGVAVGDQTLLCEMNRRFIRGHYAEDINLPKAR